MSSKKELIYCNKCTYDTAFCPCEKCEVEYKRTKIKCPGFEETTRDEKKEDSISSFLINASKMYYERLINGVFKHVQSPATELFPYANHSMDSIIKSEKKELKLEDIKNTSTDCILIGAGGYGKTTSIFNAWNELIDIKLSDSSDYNYLPFFVPLNEVNNESNFDKVHFISNYINQKYSNSTFTIDLIDILSKFKQKESKNKIILLLDGFNEIKSDRINKIIIEIENLRKDYGGYQGVLKIVMTSRKDYTFTDIFFDFEKYEIKPLDKKAIIKFLKNEETIQGSIKEYDNYVEVNGHKINIEVLQIPMMLKIFTNSSILIKEIRSNGLFLPFFDSNNTVGELLNNFFYCHIGKAYNKIKTNECTEIYIRLISLYITAPYIAYQIESKNEYDFNGYNYDDYVRKSINDNVRLQRIVKSIPKIHTQYEKLINISEADLIEGIKRVLSGSEGAGGTGGLTLTTDTEGKMSFIHQHYRDFFSCVQICYEIIEAVNKFKITNEIDEKNSWFPEVMYTRRFPNYLADMIGGYLRDYLNKKRKQEPQNILHDLLDSIRGIRENGDEKLSILIYNIIKIQTRARNDILSTENYSNIDFRNISLNGIRFSDENGVAIFSGAIISSGTFLYQGHIGQVRSVMYNNDETIILSSGDTSTKEWNTKTNRCIATYRGHKDLVTFSSYNHDNSRILSASSDLSIKVWERGVENKHPLEEIEKHTEYVITAYYNNAGDKIISSARDGYVYQHEINDSGQRKSIIIAQANENHEKGKQHIFKSAVYNKYEDICLTASGDGIIAEWSINQDEYNSLKLIIEYKGHKNVVNSAIYDVSNRYILSGSFDNTFIIWERGSNNHLVFNTNHMVRRAIFNLDATIVYVASGDGSIQQWEVKEVINKWNTEIDPRVVKFEIESKTPSPVTFISLSKDGSRLLSSYEDATIIEWDIETKQPLHIYRGLDYEITSTVYSNKKDHLFNYENSKDGKEERRNDGTPTRILKHNSIITSADYSPKDENILTTTEDGLIHEWDRKQENGQELPIIQTNPKTYKSVNSNSYMMLNAKYNEKGNEIISLAKKLNNDYDESCDYLIQIWVQGEYESNPRKEFMSLKFPANQVSYSEKDGIFITFYKGIIREWDLESGNFIGIYGIYINNCNFEGCLFMDSLAKSLVKESEAKFSNIILSEIYNYSFTKHLIISSNESKIGNRFIGEVYDCCKTESYDFVSFMDNGVKLIKKDKLKDIFIICKLRAIDAFSITANDIFNNLILNKEIYGKILVYNNVYIEKESDLEESHEYRVLLYLIEKLLTISMIDNINDDCFLNKAIIFIENISALNNLQLPFIECLNNLFPNMQFVISTTNKIEKNDRTKENRDLCFIDLDTHKN